MIRHHVYWTTMLRSAQLQTMQENGRQAPYYWAAFTLTGDYRGSSQP